MPTYATASHRWWYKEEVFIYRHESARNMNLAYPERLAWDTRHRRTQQQHIRREDRPLRFRYRYLRTKRKKKIKNSCRYVPSMWVTAGALHGGANWIATSSSYSLSRFPPVRYPPYTTYHLKILSLSPSWLCICVWSTWEISNTRGEQFSIFLKYMHLWGSTFVKFWRFHWGSLSFSLIAQVLPA